MSKIWSGEQMGAAAQPLGGWGRFGSVGGSGNGFRSMYNEEQVAPGSRAWNVTPPAEPTHMPEMLPEIDPIEEAAQQAFVQGFQEGERLTREALELDNAVRAELTAALQLVARGGEGELAAMLGQAVTRLVSQIIGEVQIDQSLLQTRCEAVAACIDADDSRAVLEVNPEDLPLLAMEGLDVALAPSADLPRGSVRLATADGWVEDGPDVRLDRLKALMDDMEGRV